MLRPVRTLALMALVFVAGVLFERQQQAGRCAEAGGSFGGGLCRGLVSR